MVFALLVLLAASASFEESFKAGLLALQRNDLTTAATQLEAAARLAPKNSRVWVALAQTYWKRNERSKADAAADKAAALASGDALALKTLAMYYGESGRPVKSAEALARYTELSPQDTQARERAESLFFEAAQPLLQQAKFAEALEILKTATKHLKNSAQLELALGVAYYGLRRFDDAAEAFVRTISISPSVEQPYLFLGKFLDQIPGRLPEITKKFAEYRAANPESFTGYFLHAKALNAQAIEPETSRKLLVTALAINDRDGAAHFELGTLLEAAQNYGEAAREYERAAELAPADPAPHYRLARVYDRLGKAEAAQAEREIHARLERAARDPVK